LGLSANMEGRFLKGRLTGYGQCCYAGGDVYKGLFQGGKRSGKGTMVFSQYNDLIRGTMESTYEGEWKLNKRNGQGVMTWPDGTTFEGEWLNDERVYGKQTMTDQNEYTGQFKDDKFHGAGKLSFSRERLLFEGLFENGLQSNLGRLTYLRSNTQEVYIGQIDDNRKHGLGILEDSSGIRYEGEFEDDIPVGLGKIIYPNGDIYYGHT